jgi:hypothetical protein
MTEEDAIPTSEEPPASEPVDASGADDVPFPEPTMDEHHYGDDQTPEIWVMDSESD